MPKNIGSLSNLKSLNFFIVKEQNISDLKELEKLNHLHGRIHIKGLGNVIDPLDVATRIWKDKKYLEEIHMTFDGRRENVSILEALQPNRNLNRLIIREYKAHRNDMFVGVATLCELFLARQPQRCCLSCYQDIFTATDTFLRNMLTGDPTFSIYVLSFFCTLS
ncbi:unnamed protein product [Vicia faba]|uniref:R13L1/DRL21-like LRR repeat region domain-containing protein n=1 Tax=Vicia faba TaxID=3906 RepID=A0AAV0ZCZ7_VICFA|nr:unnamed protein product [Vicia faba]